jgi:hypothetical protein
MKQIATILLGFTLCAPVFAADRTLHGIHEGCKERAEITGPNATRNQGIWLDVGETEGYINGYAEAKLFDGTIIHLPETNGELHDAVCQYIDLHPEIWSMGRMKGMDLVLSVLYADKK